MNMLNFISSSRSVPMVTLVTLITIMPTPRGVSSLAPLILCSVDIIPRVGRTGMSITLIPLRPTFILMVARKKCSSDRLDAMIGLIGLASHHLESLLGAIKWHVLCVFVCTWKGFNIKLGRLCYTIQEGGFNLLASLGYVTNYLQGLRLWNNLHSSSCPLLQLLT